MDQKKLEKFINRLLILVDTLEAHRKEAAIQNRTNQYYYLQKEAELLLLHEQVENATKTLKFAKETDNTIYLENATKRLKFAEDTFSTTYQEVYTRWRKDALWLHRYLTNSPLTAWREKIDQELNERKSDNSKAILL